MRSYDPDSEYDRQELLNLNPEPWMVDLLRRNPGYVSWGPGEDYMTTKEDRGWATSSVFKTWDECWLREPDDMNEIAHFYFQINRESHECNSCGRTGYGPETRKISDDFYDFARTGRRWSGAITFDEMEALIESGRLRKWNSETRQWDKQEPTQELLDRVNLANSPHGGEGLAGDHYHDAINSSILIEARARRMGHVYHCTDCHGQGHVYTQDVGHVGVVFWVLHPRKGASKGLEVERITQEESLEVLEVLRKGRARLIENFKGVL